MGLSMGEIRRGLQERGIHVRILGGANREAEAFHLLESGSVPERSLLNLCPLSVALSFSDRADCSFLCLRDCTLPPSVFEEEGSVLLCEGDVQISALVNALSDLFSEELRFSRCISELYSSLSAPDALMSAVGTAGQYLGLRMVLGDSNRVVLVHNVPEIPVAEQDWEVFLAAGVAPAFSTGEGVRVIAEETLPGGQTLTLVDNPAHDARNAICDILSNGRVIACLSILLDERREFSRAEQRLLSVLCEVIRLDLNRHAKPDMARSLPYESFLINLLETRSQDPDHIRILASKIALPPEGFFTVFDFELPEDRFERMEIPLRELMDSLETTLQESRAVNHNGRIVLLVNFGTIERYTAQDYGTLKELVERYGLLCGMSRPFHDLMNLHLPYQEALDAAAFGRYTAFISPTILDHGINSYERCEPYILMHNAADHGVDLTKFVHPFAIRLAEYDKAHDTEYVRTLFETIRSPKKPQAAEALFIHRNTLDYRLKKIQELVSFSWNDGETMARLYMSIVILQYLDMRRQWENEKRRIPLRMTARSERQEHGSGT